MIFFIGFTHHYDKMADSFGIANPSKSFVKFTEKSLRKYAKLYNTPLLQQSKRDLQLRVALDTMPHGFIWKLFHQNPATEDKIRCALHCCSHAWRRRFRFSSAAVPNRWFFPRCSSRNRARSSTRGTTSGTRIRGTSAA